MAALRLFFLFLLTLFIILHFNLRSAQSGRHNLYADFNSIRVNDYDDIISFDEKLEEHFARTDSITADEWFRALPNKEEIREMKLLIRFLFSYKTFENFEPYIFLKMFPTLAKSVTVTVLTKNHCIVHEKMVEKSNDALSGYGKFPRFWGYVAVSSLEWAKRPTLHHSAAHFQSDGEVCAQAAAIFQRTRSRSLVVAGASRFAVRGKRVNACQLHTSLADAAHNNATMFHAMNMGVLEATRNGIHQELFKDKDVFMQWHGMANTTCVNTAAFVSAGVNGSNAVYNDSSSYVNRVVAKLNKLIRPESAETPATAECFLKATTNIFGRAVNDVPETDVCSKNTDEAKVKGQFIHLEQKRWIGEDWDLWTKVIKSAFPISRRH